VQTQHFSEHAAYKRIHAVRVARRFPVLFAALAEGRIHLTGILLLAPHLTPENVAELLAGATHQTKSGIEQLLVRYFPRPDVPTRRVPVPVRPVSPPMPPSEPTRGQAGADLERPAPAAVPVELAPERVDPPAPKPKLTPLAPQRFAFTATLDQETP
jgi:hypothetical protein